MRLTHPLFSMWLVPMAMTVLLGACAEEDAQPKRRTSGPVGTATPESTTPQTTAPQNGGTTTPTTQTPAALTWKALLMTGDDSIDAFDNARKKMKELIVAKGITAENIKELSMSSSEQTGSVMASTAANMQTALQSLTPTAGSACFIHMTSHGSRTGFFMKGQSELTPSKLNEILDQTCGDRPTVLLVSACYSGLFINETTSKPNRIILTAARKDRTSFGCSAEETYVYWDTCLIETLPTAANWNELYTKIDSCIESKESQGSFTPSEPQSFFGTGTTSLPVFAATL